MAKASVEKPKKNILLAHSRGLGDVVVMTALVRDFALARGHEYEIGVAATWRPLWDNNPYLAPWSPCIAKADSPKVPKDTLRVELSYRDYIGYSHHNEFHFLQAFYKDLHHKTKISVPLRIPRPDLHLSAKEKSRPLVSGRYWVIVDGGKMDITVKHWDHRSYQEVVDILRPRGIRFVHVGATHHNHVHRPLRDVLDMVGKTDHVRDLLNVIYHAEGIVCPVTGPMHIAAAFEKPAVVIAGGREDPHWEAYANHKGFGPHAEPVRVPHKFLHNVGQLSCCSVGCWRPRVVALDARDRNPNKKRVCLMPRKTADGFDIAECMRLITPDHVAEAVMAYYDEKVLPPIGQPSGKLREVEAPFSKMEEPALIGEPKTPYKPPQGTDFTIAPSPVMQPLTADIFDHPKVGGKFTICGLCYGRHTDLAKRMIDSILSSVPRNRMDLRLAANECCDETAEVIRAANADKTYISHKNRLKYPVMRDILWDKDKPVTTPWLIWFDDDSYVVDRNWLVNLCGVISGQPDNVGMIGVKWMHPLQNYVRRGHDPREWFRKGSWFKNRPFQDKKGRPTPNGEYIHFISGGFWAVRMDAVRRCDIPDPRVLHRGDIAIGAQLWQNGYEVKDWGRDKKFVRVSDAPRRGVNAKVPWDPT